MTYCLGILLPAGLVMASDSRSNAGVDHVTHVCKQTLFAKPGERVIAMLSAGNLATTQAVVGEIRQSAGSGRAGADVLAAPSFFEIARIVGDTLRAVVERDGKFVEPYGDGTGSFIVGGQIAGEAPRLFEIYPAGNFVEACERSFFLQIGETKYGKPILDRALIPACSLDEAAKLALLSFDATIRSNLSVGLPIDLFRYETGSLSAENRVTFEETSTFWTEITARYGQGLAELIHSLPAPHPGGSQP